MSAVSELTLRVSTGGDVKSGVPTPLVMPSDWSPWQVAVFATVVHASGPALALRPYPNMSAPAATVPSSAARQVSEAEKVSEPRPASAA